MKTWEQLKDEIRRVSSDKEMARSILKMAKTRKDLAKLLENKRELSSILIETYYEIIKELISGIMAVDGYKTLSHEALVAYLERDYPKFSDSQISIP